MWTKDGEETPDGSPLPSDDPLMYMTGGMVEGSADGNAADGSAGGGAGAEEPEGTTERPLVTTAMPGAVSGSSGSGEMGTGTTTMPQPGSAVSSGSNDMGGVTSGSNEMATTSMPQPGSGGAAVSSGSAGGSVVFQLELANVAYSDSFNAAALAASIAQAAGVAAGDVAVALSLNVTSSLVFATQLTALTLAQNAAVAAVIRSMLGEGMPLSIQLGSAAPMRRLLDVAAPLVVSGCSSPARAAALVASLQTPSAMAAIATAGGATSASASVPAISAAASVSVRYADAATASGITAALGADAPSTAAAMSAVLTDVGAAGTVTVTQAPALVVICRWRRRRTRMLATAPPRPDAPPRRPPRCSRWWRRWCEALACVWHYVVRSRASALLSIGLPESQRLLYVNVTLLVASTALDDARVHAARGQRLQAVSCFASRLR
jgi:hypothetical protein